MKFKAELNSISFTLNDRLKLKPDTSFIFTRSQIFYKEKNRNWKLDNLNITEGDYYELRIIDNINRLKRYEITVNKKYIVNLILTKKNEFLLKWIHKRFYIQKDSSNWLKAALIGIIASIITYIVGQSIGFQKGYQDGLKKANIKSNAMKS